LRGVDVALVERGGTSGRSHGVLHSGARCAESDPTGAEECIEENRIVSDIAGECIRDTGGLSVQLPGDDPGVLRPETGDLRGGRHRGRKDSPGIARETAPGLSSDVERVLRVPDAKV